MLQLTICLSLLMASTASPSALPLPELDYGSKQPQQIHLAYGETVSEVVVTWVTEKNTDDSTVHYGPVGDLLKHEKDGTSTNFTDGGDEHRTMWIHRVHLMDLLSDTRYVYRCGSDQGWSELFTFKTVPRGVDWTLSIAMYGDLGLKNPQSLSRLQLEAEDGMYDTILHVGDFAYNMNDDNARVGDAFMNNIQPIAAYVPYMTCPGNHEEKRNFENYKARFTMPMFNQSQNMYYSWNIGLVHFVSINTEAFYYLNYGIAPLVKMHKWLVEDLKEATKPEARNQRPWIILYGHRPMYCSNADKDDCTNENCLVRVGLPVLKWFGIEELLAQYGVDLAVWAHEHSYERLYPMYDYQILNGTSSDNPYHNPRGPVSVITGSAGNQERKDYFLKKPDWSAFRSNDYGYTRLNVLNETHIYWEQVSDDQDGEIVDKVWLIREEHTPYKVNC